jgi:hypothetical protein
LEASERESSDRLTGIEADDAPEFAEQTEV